MNEKIIAAIPTEYAGVRFRSRLEARWAAFFDIYEIPWEYEPIDFKGWIPDFLIPGKINTYVEIKPTKVFLPDVWKKIRANQMGMGGADVMLLGDFFIAPHGYPTSGWLSEYSSERYEHPAWLGDPHDTAADWCQMAWSNAGENKLDFYHSTMNFAHRISGAYDGNAYAYFRGDVKDLIYSWNRAGSTVQWKP